MSSTWVLLVFLLSGSGGGPVTVGPYNSEKSCQEGAERVRAELDKPLRTLNMLCMEVRK